MSLPTPAGAAGTDAGTLKAWLARGQDTLRRLWAEARRLRWPAAAGALLGLVGLLVSTLAVPALQAERESLASQAQAMRTRIARAAQTPPPPAAEQQAAAFRDGFPGAAERQQRVAALLQAAQAAGLSPRRTEFRYEAERATGLARYRVTLPLDGEYTQLRSFLGRALVQDTALSLDLVRLRRTNPQQALLQAEFSFTFHMRDGAELADSRLPQSVAAMKTFEASR